MSSVSRLEVLALAAVERFREMILEYAGPPEGLRDLLLRELRKLELKGDAILADLMDEVL